METDFVSWLIAAMNDRGWSNTELAQRAGVVQSTVSMVLSQRKQPGLDFCVGIARAFHLPPETVLRRAGLIPGAPDDNENVGQMVYIMNQLDEATQRMLVAEARAIYEFNQHEPRAVREPNP